MNQAENLSASPRAALMREYASAAAGLFAIELMEQNAIDDLFVARHQNSPGQNLKQLEAEAQRWGRLREERKEHMARMARNGTLSSDCMGFHSLADSQQ